MLLFARVHAKGGRVRRHDSQNDSVKTNSWHMHCGQRISLSYRGSGSGAHFGRVERDGERGVYGQQQLAVTLAPVFDNSDIRSACCCGNLISSSTCQMPWIPTRFVPCIQKRWLWYDASNQVDMPAKSIDSATRMQRYKCRHAGKTHIAFVWCGEIPPCGISNQLTEEIRTSHARRQPRTFTPFLAFFAGDSDIWPALKNCKSSQPWSEVCGRGVDRTQLSRNHRGCPCLLFNLLARAFIAQA